MSRLQRILPLLVLVVPALCRGAEMHNVDVQFRDGHYYVRSEVFMHAGQEAVFSVFLDWDLATEFSSVVTESRRIDPETYGKPGYYMKNRGCVLFFCKTTVRQGIVESEPYSQIRAVADPEKSDFEVSDETWTFKTDGNGTLVLYTLDMKPAFWVPPIVGPMIIKRKLANDGEEAMDRIEALAQQRSARRD